MSDGVFPEGFVWGTATAAYQVEGAVHADGRGESVWDRFSHTPGRVQDGDTGDDACDHYHRWASDLDLMAELGVTGYRFSISWPRVMPEGKGSVNHKGLDFYDRLIDGMLERGIAPFPTLYHWDLPQALEDRGGWAARDTAHAFADYAEAVAARLGDRVERWMTHNEPWCASILGYMDGYHAPGRTGTSTGLTAAHHILLSHGLAAPRLRSYGGKVGIVLNPEWKVPASSHPADQAAADLAHQKMFRWFADPLFGRGYPEGAMADYGWDAAAVLDGDLDEIACPLDQLGINYYTREVVRSNQIDESERSDPIRSGPEFTDMGWEVQPAGLTFLLELVSREYFDGPIYVTENGAAYPDAEDFAGFVDDHDRVGFLGRHLEAVDAAIAKGVHVAGYFLWSFLDNFEWAFGYSKRFGIVRTDFDTQARIPKASFHWYRKVIDTNGLDLSSPDPRNH